MGVLTKQGNKTQNHASKANVEIGANKPQNAGDLNASNDEYKSNITMTTFNLCNAILGAGIIGIPFALKEAGFGLGVIMLIVAAAITDYTLCLLIHAGKLANTNTYWNTMKTAFGRPGLVIMTFVIIMFPLISLTTYNMMITDNVSKLMIRITNVEDIDDLRSHIWGRREVLMLIILGGTIVPLALYRNVSQLAKWSVLALVMLFIIILVFALRLATLDLPSEPGSYKFARFDVLQSIGIITTAYLCHDSSFLVFNSMKNPTERRWDEVTHISLAISLLGNLAVGVLGYATFTENVQGNILENYCNDDDIINVARFLFVLSVILSAPIDVFVVRNALELLFFADSQPSPLWRHVGFTLLIIAISYGLSNITECLSVVLEISGLLLAVPIGLVFPPLMVLKLEQISLLHYKNIPRWLLLLAALGVLVAGMYETIREIIVEGVTCSAGQEPAFCLLDDVGTTVSP